MSNLEGKSMTWRPNGLTLCMWSLAAVALGASNCDVLAATLFSENFDADHSGAWMVNNNGWGTNSANFFYDYSAMGIAPAPHSQGGTTRGLRLGANLSSATAPTSSAQVPGVSVSPIGQAFSGDYVLRFDWWINFLGPLSTGSTATVISTSGLLTSGTTPNYAGAMDGVVFAATGDGASSADYRAYSSERMGSYVTPPSTPQDSHVLYAAGSRNNTAAYYQSHFPGGIAAPTTQQMAFSSQSGSTASGTLGFQWRDMTIVKTGEIINWSIDGALIATVDASAFSVPTGGTNILFGQTDVNNTTSLDPNFGALAFSLIDNVTITTIPEPRTLTLLAVALAYCYRRVQR